MDDLLEMSDSAFMEKAVELRSTPTTTSPDNTDAEAALAAVEQKGVEGEEEVTTTTEEDTNGLQNEEQGNQTEEVTSDSDGTEAKATDTENEQKQEETTTTNEPNYKAMVEQLLSPFKANGREIKVESVDEAISLMQMGANYSKKMAAMKPHLQMLRTLEKNNLLSQDKLNLLVELDKGNPEAIANLLRTKNIDPLDLDIESAASYTPVDHKVGDSEFAVEEAFNVIEHTPTYNDTVNVIASLDDASKREIANDVGFISALNSHIASGIYQKVMAEVDKQKALGNFAGMSTLAAYCRVGDLMNQKGLLSTAANSATQTAQQVAGKPPVQQTATAVAANLAAKKKAAATPRTNKAVKTDPMEGLDPLMMSDEEFLRISKQRH